MKKKSFDRYLPFWTGKDNHWTVFWGCIIAAAGLSIYQYSEKLYFYAQAQALLSDSTYLSSLFPSDQMMPNLIEILTPQFLLSGIQFLFSDKPVFWSIPLLFLTAAILAVYHYSTLRRGAKSNYLMGRLPDRKELRRRCLTLPLLMVLAGVVLVAVLLPIFYGAYLLATPDGRMQPDQLTKLWQGFPNLFLPLSPLYVHVN